jgi:hypothetical protein
MPKPYHMSLTTALIPDAQLTPRSVAHASLLRSKVPDTLFLSLTPILLSKSTEDYDRGGQFEHYRTLASLQEYLLAAQERYHVVHYVRQPDHTWLLAETYDMHGGVHLPSIHCDLLLSEVYAKVRLDR